MLALDDKWIWDFWLARDGGNWHIFFLQADKALGDPDQRHWHVSIGHAVSADLRNWRHLGTCFAPAPAGHWDDCTTWTGSVIKENGQWHLFYTGTHRAERGLKQRIGHATSTDLHNWQRAGDAPLVDLDTRWYEEHDPAQQPPRWHDRALRDPWVMRDPDGNGWLMYFTARSPQIAETKAAGVIGLARSDDFKNWAVQPPVYNGGHFGELEVPQVFAHRGKWYCLFCTTSGFWSEAQSAACTPVTGTHYLMADSPLGPWQVAPCPFLDGSAEGARYSGKIVADGDKLFFLAFERTGKDGRFQGRVCDPIAVIVDENGLLSLAAD